MSASDSAMTPIERRASIGLAGIYGLRMLGLFIILPIFALYAEKLPGGQSHFLIGIALGAYGLTQSILQIPAGWLSDRYGRKPVIIVGLLLFAAGSFIAASADDIYWIIFGRVIQGAGAINAAVMALTADLTREEHRTKAMAMIGITIGITFSISMVLSPVLYRFIGMSGMFTLIGVLAFISIGVVLWFIPNPTITRFHSDTEANTSKFAEVLRNKDLLRMDFGVFTLHAVLMSVFMQIPFILRTDGLDAQHQWQVYLPVMLIAFALMVPPIIIAEKKAKMKQVFMFAIALAAVAQVAMLFLHSSIMGVSILVADVLHRFQRAGSDTTFHRQQDRAAGRQRNGDGRIQQRAVPRRLLRLGHGRIADAVLRWQCRAGVCGGHAAAVAGGRFHHAGAAAAGDQDISPERNGRRCGTHDATGAGPVARSKRSAGGGKRTDRTG